MTGSNQLFLASRALLSNTRRGAFTHRSVKFQRKSKQSLHRHLVGSKSPLSTITSTSAAHSSLCSLAILPSQDNENAGASRRLLAATTTTAAMIFGIVAATASYAFPRDQRHAKLSKIHSLNSFASMEGKPQVNDDIDESGSLAAKSENTPSARKEELSAREPAQATTIATSYAPALDMYPTRPPPGVRELGKALAEMHEKQKVVLGRMLHDLNQLAQEALSREGTHSSALRSVDNSIHNIDDNDKKYIKIPQELEKITPQEAWGIIQQLQHKSPQEGSLTDEGENKILSRSDIKKICSTAAELLRSEPTVIDLRDRKDLEMITVVGDLHGQFESLLDVFELVGNKGFGPNPPSSTSYKTLDVANISELATTSGKNNISSDGTPWDGTGAIVFNGDFVDRGENSLGVLITLLLLKIAFPNHVILNRGNHEDDLLSTVYGFTEELESLYATKHNKTVDDIWEAIGDVFAALPVCVCTPSAVIMHGGIPSEDFTLDELRSITPEKRCQVRSVLETEGCKTKEMLQNVMWSDPKPQEGVVPNEDRGAGVCFGPDVTRKFLDREGFDFLIRSHEPVDMGYERLECDDESAGAVTVFSAARYPCGEGYNWGAVIRLTLDGGYEPLFFQGRDESEQDSRDTDELSYSERTFNELSKVIARKSAQLISSFGEMAKLNEYVNNDELSETNGRLLITEEQWATAMSEKLDLGDVDWLSLRPFLARTVKKKIVYDDDTHDVEMIDYTHFLDLHCNLSLELDQASMSNLQQNHSVLLNVFKFLDSDRSGQIDRDEFRIGVELLNRRSQEGKVIEDPDSLFDSIDDDGNGELDIHEFESAFTASSTPYHIACFKKFDADNSGFIDREEFHGALEALNKNLPPGGKFDLNEADVIFDRLDADASGELDLEEFQQLLRDAGYLPSKM